MKNKTPIKEARDFLKKHPELEAVDLLLCDLNGILRGKRIEASSLLKVYQQGIYIAESIWASDITGETIEETGLGRDIGYGDNLCFPVEGSLHLSPWQSGCIAQCRLATFDQSGEPYAIDPREIIKQLHQKLAAKNLNPVIALELEFFLLPSSFNPFGDNKAAQQSTSTQLYCLDDLEQHAEFLRAISEAAKVQNIPISGALAEDAPGQFEINLTHQTDPLLAADHAIELKRLIKGVAKQFGFTATFMAKPFMAYAGSGTHIHISLYDRQGKNAFYAKAKEGSQKLQYAANGLIELMPESMLLFAPHANSYRRFSLDSYVAKAANWGFNNRTVALRVPLSEPQHTRIEHRVSGADCNPYLLTASVLTGILYGIELKEKPPTPLKGDTLSAEQLNPLPLSWESALNRFTESTILQHYFGEDFIKVYRAIKAEELKKFNRQVTPTELNWYLSTNP